MEAIDSLRPLFAVLVSIAVVPFLITARSANLRETWTFVAAGMKFVLVLSLLPGILSGNQYTCTLFAVVPGVALQLRVDAFGMLFALVASPLWIVTTVYSMGYMRGLKEHSQTRYFCYFALALSATIGVAFSANLLTLYVFYEILSLATYPLVTHHQDGESRISGRKYLGYILGGSVGLALPAMLLTYTLTGSLDFAGGGVLPSTTARGLTALLLFLFIFGFAKAAVMPLHAWLPAAMVAPTPVSALLHAVAVVKVGVFSVVRVITGILGVDLLGQLNLGPVICYTAAFTIIVGSLIALSQGNLKRMLAFSTIAQLSYVVLGVGLLSPKGMTGGVLHIAMHAFGKITLFFCAGAIFVATGKKELREMVGIGRRMPFTMAAFFFGALSIIGLPPCGGFLSKWWLALGALEAHQFTILVVLLVSSFLNAAYFMPVVYRAFFQTSEEFPAHTGVREAPLFCLIPPLVTAAASIGLFFYPQPFFRLAHQFIATLTGL